MRKIVDKIVLVAHICISAIFVLVTLLMFTNVIPLTLDSTGAIVLDGFVMAIVIILTSIYVAMTAYLLYGTFAQRNVIRQVLLYADEYNETNANSTVIRRIANDSAKLVSGVKVKKLRITTGEKGKMHMKLTVTVESNDVSYSLDTLRCLLVDHYATVLSLTFDSIDFAITKVKSDNTPDLDKAISQADTLKAGRVITKEIAEQPIVEVGNITTEVVAPTEQEEATTETAEEAFDAEAEQMLEDQKRKDYEKKATAMFGTPETPLVDEISVEIVDEELEQEEEATTPTKN